MISLLKTMVIIRVPFVLPGRSLYNKPRIAYKVSPAVKTNRPVNLNLMTMHFPVTAVVSILHRLTGVVLLLLLPVVLCLLDCSLRSPESFANLQAHLAQPWAKAVVLVLLAPMVYHLVAGFRHLLMDVGIGESLQGGRVGAYANFVVTIIVMALAGVWLCQ